MERYSPLASRTGSHSESLTAACDVMRHAVGSRLILPSSSLYDLRHLRLSALCISSNLEQEKDARQGEDSPQHTVAVPPDVGVLVLQQRPDITKHVLHLGWTRIFDMFVQAL